MEVTADDRAAARAGVKKSARGTTVGGISFLLIATFGGVVITQEAFAHTSELLRAALSAGITGRDRICMDGHTTSVVAPTLTALG